MRFRSFVRTLTPLRRGALALTFGIAAVAGCAPVTAQHGSTAPAERARQCESGVVNGDDGVLTSSAVLEQVPSDAELPPGCHWAD